MRPGRRRTLFAQMAKPKTKKRRVKGAASSGFFRRRKWVWVPVLVLLLIPAIQVAAVRFVDPPRTLPMWIEQVSSSGAKAPLRYRWIPLAQMPEMFLKHLWISEDQRFFQHEGFDWKEMDLAVKEADETSCCPAFFGFRVLRAADLLGG